MVIHSNQREIPTEQFSSISGADSFAMVAAGFEKAAYAFPDLLQTFTVRLGGKQVRFRVLGHALATTYRRPFQHLVINPNGDPDLSIDLWDGDTTSTPNPVHDDTVIQEANSEHPGTRLYRSANSRYVGTRGATGHSWIDLEVDRLVGWVTSVDLLSHEEKGKSFLKLLPFWFEMLGMQWMHGGVVANNDRGILLCGPGGTGKSTTSLACLLAGFEYLGDDFVLVETSSVGAVMGHSLYCSGQLYPEQLEKFPDLAAMATPGFSLLGKTQVFVPEVFGTTMRQSVPIVAIGLPVIADQEITGFRRANAGETLRRLTVGNVMFPFVASRRNIMERLARVIEQVPAYWIDGGRNLATIAPAVAQLLDEVR